ncbi:hypothetical protein Ancab_020585 [Ancistrocladus abbreviatus]
METDDTSSNLPPSAVKLRLQWDVFLSFKRADESDTFAGRLSEAHKHDGVRVFIGGDHLTRGGDVITPSHVEAVEDSAAGIAIISSKYADSRDESVVQLIVRRIRNVLSNSPVHVATHVVGLDFRVETVLMKLDVKSPGFRVLGIHGTPGIEKTTIAKAAFNKLIGHFKQRCFISNVNETWKKGSLSGVQRKVLSHLELQGSTGNKADAEVSTSFQKVIHENLVLVVLDDVANAGLLDSLGIKRRKIDEGSRIIITSRDKNVVDQDTLPFSEKKGTNPRVFDLAAEIVRLTGGLPLTLEVFGSSLLDKRSKREWEEALQKLQIYRPPRLQDVLKLSYDGLDMGRQIDMDKDIQPGKRTGLWDTNDIMTVLQDKQGTNEVQGIVLSNRKKLVNELTAEDISWHNFQREPNVSTATTYLRGILNCHNCDELNGSSKNS